MFCPLKIYLIVSCLTNLYILCSSKSLCSDYFAIRINNLAHLLASMEHYQRKDKASSREIYSFRCDFLREKIIVDGSKVNLLKVVTNRQVLI